jgi:integrase
MITGARFDELINLRPRDFDFERNNVRIWKTKTKAKKGEKVGKPRTISLSSDFNKKIKKYSSEINPEDFLFKISQAGYNQLLKKKLKELKVDGAEEFSSHNLRKTHGMYLKALGIDIAEICTRLGHDYNTYIKHYGSADVFSEKDMRGIRELLGDLYFRQRRF